VIRTHAIKYLIEVTDGDKPEGVIASHGLEVSVEDDGGGVYLQCVPVDLNHHGDGPMALAINSEEEIDGIAEALKKILRDANWSAGE
jgi:hypothetical protein